MKKDILILGIESSCDETSVAVVKNGREVLSMVTNTQIDIHKLYGGVVPEIASRNHVMNIDTVYLEALAKAGVTIDDIDAIAVTYGAGLLGALIVGVNFAKALAYSTGKPLIAVNHIEGHIAANYIAHKELKPPFACLIVSGGHTALVEMESYTKRKLVGTTTDDAIGEAFDKVARVLGLQYPGGPNIERLAQTGKNVVPMPKMLKGNGGYNFSYSGLKTAVLNYCHTKSQKGEEYSKADVACSFQSAALDILVEKTVQGAKEKGVTTVTAGGGVVANGYLREALTTACQKAGLKLVLPEKRYCTDNATMIAAEGLLQYRMGNFAAMDVNAKASIPLSVTIKG